MVKIKNRRTASAEIPTTSMSDISFLLLLFFLVSTVIDVDTGIGLTLPEYNPKEEEQTVPFSKDRLAAILINQNGNILFNQENISLPQIKTKLIEKISSKIGLPKSKKIVVSVKTDRNTNYNLYIQALDQVKGAYFEVRQTYSKNKYGKKVYQLNKKEQNDIKEEIPITISIAEPEQIKK